MQYDASKLAVINIRDLEGVKNAINVITPDGARIFQCISPKTKVNRSHEAISVIILTRRISFQTEWIEKFEVALKFNQASGVATKSSKKQQAPQPPKQIQQQKSFVDTKSIISSEMTLSPDSVTSIQINWGPDWLLTAPEEILALIAQRHFDEALTLITDCEEHFAKDSTFYGAPETIEKVIKCIVIYQSFFNSFFFY